MDRDEKLQQLSVGIQAMANAAPALMQGDALTGVIALGGVLSVSVIDNILRRHRKLDETVQDALRDPNVADRVDPSVKEDEFFALYVRAKDAASKSEKEQKLRYIRNVLLNAITVPQSTDPDKERYLRLVDELSFRELEYFVDFCRRAAEGNYQSIDQFVSGPQRASLMLDAYVRATIGMKPSDRSTPELIQLNTELTVTFRRLESVGLLDGIGDGGDTYMYRTNGFTPRFLAFILDPSPLSK